MRRVLESRGMIVLGFLLALGLATCLGSGCARYEHVTVGPEGVREKYAVWVFAADPRVERFDLRKPDGTRVNIDNGEIAGGQESFAASVQAASDLAAVWFEKGVAAGATGAPVP